MFLDLSKAFDKVPHSLLLQKMESLNINLHLLNWIQDYLCNISQYVVVNGESSTSAPVVSGIPQGSVLGPLFFFIYINDITEVCLSDGCMLLYADNILLHRQIQSVSDYLLIQQDIDALQDWLKYNYLDLNSTKCKYMTISRKRTSLQPVLCLSISGHPLERVTAFKYLGVWISDNLTWSKHIKHAVKRATKQTGMIFRRFYTSSNINIATLKQLYLSFVRPDLEYAAQVWNPHLRTHINSLERVQKFALRMCCKNWNEPYDARLARTDIPTLSPSIENSSRYPISSRK